MEGNKHREGATSQGHATAQLLGPRPCLPVAAQGWSKAIHVIVSFISAASFLVFQVELLHQVGGGAGML